MKVAAHGLAVNAPAGWEARIYRRDPDGDGATTHPVLHAGTFALPVAHGDFGSSAVVQMRASDVFVVLVEYDAGSAGTALFANRGMPHPQAGDFDPRKLQRTLPGQSGAQWFFTLGQRAFCLYIVLGSHARRARLVPQVHALLAGLSVW